MPSPCGALTSAPCVSSVFTAARSPRFAASATVEDAGECAAIATALTTSATIRFTPSRFMPVSCYVYVGRTLRSGTIKADLKVRPTRMRRLAVERKFAGAVAKRREVVHPEHVHRGQHRVGHRRALG